MLKGGCIMMPSSDLLVIPDSTSNSRAIYWCRGALGLYQRRSTLELQSCLLLCLGLADNNHRSLQVVLVQT